MNQAQHDWIERCTAGNPGYAVAYTERVDGRVIVEVYELRPRRRTMALILLGPNGEPEQVDQS